VQRRVPPRIWTFLSGLQVLFCQTAERRLCLIGQVLTSSG